MLAEGPSTPYETFCHSCRVSFPVGTRRCIHCGERIGRERMVVRGPLPSTPEGEIGEEELPTRMGRFSPIAGLWLLLALGGALYRACTGG